MARKHCAPHNRGRSRYKNRLAKRGLRRAPNMTPWNPDSLAAQARREFPYTALEWAQTRRQEEA